MQGDKSSSDFIRSDILDIDKSFTDFSEIKTCGFNLLIKAKRYGKWYLLKGLKSEYCNQTLYKALLRKEFEISILMDHPNIIKTIGFEEIPEIGYCIIFEYLEGCTLKQFLLKKHTSLVNRKIVKELLSALSYVHKKQIVHRDLKPENIIITANGNNLKLIDFGLADTDSHAILKQPAGTAKYISPEQLNASEADCRNDIYSLGKILLEINPGFSYRLVAKHCLKDIETRYANVDEIQHALFFSNRISQIFRYFLFSILIILFFSLIYIKTGSQYRVKEVNDAILDGKNRVEEITVPLKNFIDTIRVFNDRAYMLNDQIISKRESALNHIIDSIGAKFNDYDKTVIRKSLYDYYIEITPKF